MAKVRSGRVKTNIFNFSDSYACHSTQMGTNIVKITGLIVLLGVYLTACDTSAGQEQDTAVVHIQPETLDKVETDETSEQDQASDAGAPKAETESNAEEQEGSAAGETPKSVEANEPSSEQAGEKNEAPQISYEILRSARTDDTGEEVIFVEYPRISVAGDDYPALSAALASISQEWQADSEALLENEEERVREYRESIDPSCLFSREAGVDITRCDSDIVSIVIGSMEELGGPHPNYDTCAYNLNVKTGETLHLSDVLTVDDMLRETIRMQLYENYPELDFDDTLLRQEIADHLENHTMDWYFWEGKVCIAFREGAFGFGHAEGSLGVLLPLG